MHSKKNQKLIIILGLLLVLNPIMLECHQREPADGSASNAMGWMGQVASGILISKFAIAAMTSVATACAYWWKARNAENAALDSSEKEIAALRATVQTLKAQAFAIDTKIKRVANAVICAGTLASHQRGVIERLAHEVRAVDQEVVKVRSIARANQTSCLAHFENLTRLLHANTTGLASLQARAEQTEKAVDESYAEQTEMAAALETLRARLSAGGDLSSATSSVVSASAQRASAIRSPIAFHMGTERELTDGTRVSLLGAPRIVDHTVAASPSGATRTWSLAEQLLGPSINGQQRNGAHGNAYDSARSAPIYGSTCLAAIFCARATGRAVGEVVAPIDWATPDGRL